MINIAAKASTLRKQHRVRRPRKSFALSILLFSMIGASIAPAEEMFKRLSEKEIRARVVGKDITDSTHWASYLRPDGGGVLHDRSRHQTGHRGHAARPTLLTPIADWSRLR
jgi:hypothetical protein